MIILTLLHTLIYYQFQLLYDLFVITFIVLSAIDIEWLALSYYETRHHHPELFDIRYSLFKQGFLWFAIVGSTIWFFDMFMSETLSYYYQFILAYCRGIRCIYLAYGTGHHTCSKPIVGESIRNDYSVNLDRGRDKGLSKD
jgi:hypothetical protein